LKDKIADENAGSTFDEVSGKTMKEYEAIIPPKDLTDEFTNVATQLFKQQELKEQENSKLSELQSLLLAKTGKNNRK
jgi:restriction endonuclease S subunit